MTFDEQLRRAFDTLTDRLRDEIDRQVQSAMDELAASARAEVDAAAARAEADAAAARAEADVAAARAEADVVAARAEVDAVAARAEADVAAARAEADAAVAAAAAAPTVLNVPVPAEAPAPVDAQTTEHLLETIRAIDRARSLTEILNALINGVAQDGIDAGVWLVHGGQLRHWRSTGVDTPHGDVPFDDHGALAEAARTNAPAHGDGFAVPIALAGQVVAVVHATNPESHVLNADAIEIVVRYAARCLEAQTAFKTARAMTDRAGAASAPPAPPAPARAPGDAEDHVSAQRYARLLVSEIKLYHEDAVREGRRDRDLATRLGGEIARARAMYEQRVPPHIRQHDDYFHDELVRTLADGDASLLELRT
jgi:hypothetical protein